MPDTLKEAQDRLLQTLHRGEGLKCPCCEQWAQVWRRALGKTIAGPLIDIHRRAEAQRAEYEVAGDAGPRTGIDVALGYVDVRQFGYRGGDYAKGEFWGLLEAHPTQSNVFRLTDAGVAFVTEGTYVPRYALIYNDEVVGFSAEVTNIETAMGTDFDIDALRTVRTSR